jgi:hypothetical protein
VAESDLGAAPLAAAQGAVTVTSAAEQPEGHREWAWVIALVALAFLLFDVWYFTRDPRAKSPVAGPAVARPRLPERRPT